MTLNSYPSTSDSQVLGRQVYTTTSAMIILLGRFIFNYGYGRGMSAGPQATGISSPGPEVTGIESHLRALRIELGSSARAEDSANHWATSPATGHSSIHSFSDIYFQICFLSLGLLVQTHIFLTFFTSFLGRSINLIYSSWIHLSLNLFFHSTYILNSWIQPLCLSYSITSSYVLIPVSNLW